mgnify:CR=1 FL=1
MAVKALDEVPNYVKLPPLGNIIHFLAIDGDEGLNILHGKRPDKAFSTISPSELSRPRLDFHAVKSALEIVTGGQNQITYVSDLPFRKDLVIGISMADLHRDLQIFSLNVLQSLFSFHSVCTLLANGCCGAFYHSRFMRWSRRSIASALIRRLPGRYQPTSPSHANSTRRQRPSNKCSATP